MNSDESSLNGLFNIGKWMLIFCKINLSAEAHFHIYRFANRQNCRIWGSENPHVVAAPQVHPQCVTFWCRFWACTLLDYTFLKSG